MICERCGTVFCWDKADEGGGPKLYCTRTCQKNAAKARALRNQHRTQVLLRMCRERPKTGYATREAALLAVAQLRRIPPLHPYECPCGWWHLTSEPSGRHALEDVPRAGADVMDRVLEGLRQR